MANNLHAPTLTELLAQLDIEDEITETASSSPTSVSPFNIKNFEAFLVKSHCDENFEFWKCCNYYLMNADKPTFDFVQWNTKIYENFIQVNAPMECNLPEDIRKAYTDWYVDSIIPDREIVLKARQHALNLMSDAYRQFVRYTNTATPPPPSPSVTVSTNTRKVDPTGYFPQQQEPNVRWPPYENELSFGLKRSLTTGGTPRFATNISNSSSSATSSKSEFTEPTSSSTQKLFNKGRALVTKLKRKTKRPSLNSSSSGGSAVVFRQPLKRGASDRDLDRAR